MKSKRLPGKSSLILVLAYAAFIGLGLPDSILGVAWPSMRAFFGLPIESLGALLIAFTAGYLGASFFSGPVLTRLGMSATLTVSSLAMASGLLAFFLSPYWWLVVSSAVIGGVGAGALDSALNTVASTNYSARVVNWLHASYGIGATLGPIAMTDALVRGWRWQSVYGVLAAGQVFMAAAFVLTRKMWRVSDAPQDSPRQGLAAGSRATLRLPAMWLSIALFAVYTGIEITAGQWTFTLLTEGRGVSISTAGRWLSFYWSGLTVGRIALGLFANAGPVKRLLRGCIIAAAIGAVLFYLDIAAWASFAGITLIGLALGPIFPSLIATTSSRVGASHTPNAVGFQIAAASLGGSMLPGLVGVLAVAFGLEVVSLSLIAGSVALFALHELGRASGSDDPLPEQT